MKQYGLSIAAATILFSACSDSAPEIGERSRTTAQLRQFDSCEKLHSRLKGNLREEMRVQLLQYLDESNGFNRGIAVDDSGTFDTASPSDAPGSQAPQEGVDFSGTNNQEAGVDEADFVKTDGTKIYVLNGNRLEVFGTPTFGELIAEQTTELEGYPSSMLMSDARLAVFSTVYPWSIPEEHPLRAFTETRDTFSEFDPYFETPLVKVTVLDRSDLSLVRELYIEGSQQAARRVGTSVRAVTYSHHNIAGLTYYPDLGESYYNISDVNRQKGALETAVVETIARNDAVIDATELSDFLPIVLERRPDGSLSPLSATDPDCGNFSISDDGASRGLTSIMTFDLVDVEKRFESDHIVSNWSQVYASQDVLLVAESAQDPWWFWNNDAFEEATNLHRFDIAQDGVTSYSGSGRVPGTILNQFSLGEKDGYVRVASTEGRWNRWWDDDAQEPLNFVFVLAGDDKLEIVGQTPGMAEGERIWSSRFVGDKAYLITFRNIDPLFTIDLSEPTDPQIIGELKIEGVSTYIHPLEDDAHLLTIGIAGDENGLLWGQTQLTLFDVGDFSQPTVDSEMRLAPESGNGWNYSYSEASWEHKAFQYWAPKSLLGIPLSTHREDWVNNEYVYTYSTRLELIEVDTADGTLSSYGSIDHSEFFNDSNQWWSYRDVRRSIFMGDFVYAISDRGVTAHHLDTMQLSASAPLLGPGDAPYWWW